MLVTGHHEVKDEERREAKEAQHREQGEPVHLPGHQSWKHRDLNTVRISADCLLFRLFVIINRYLHIPMRGAGVFQCLMLMNRTSKLIGDELSVICSYFYFCNLVWKENEIPNPNKHTTLCPTALAAPFALMSS